MIQSGTVLWDGPPVSLHKLVCIDRWSGFFFERRLLRDGNSLPWNAVGTLWKHFSVNFPVVTQTATFAAAKWPR
jgi:hypothetical protein